MIGSNLFTPTGNIEIALADSSGNAVLAKGTLANLPSAGAGFAVGGIYLATDTGAQFVNVGTTTASSFVGAGTGAATHATSAAVNATATLTGAQVATGYITSTSAAAVTMTLPTGALLGPALNARAGTVFDLYIDNTAGANTVTIAVATNGILSTAAVDTAASFGDLTVASGVTGLARYTIMFSSATAYVFTRTA